MNVELDNVMEIKKLKKSFDSQIVLESITFSLQKGMIYGLLGANGAGKTTIIKSIFNLITPDEGEIYLFNEAVPQSVDQYKKIGSIIETPVFYENMTVEENLLLHCDYMGEQFKNNIDKVLTEVGLFDVKKKMIDQLSLGMKQRLGLGRALLNEPELLILDEPINGLDPEGIIDFRNLILKINQTYGTTVLISSHILAEVFKIADTIGIVSQGKLIKEVSKKALEEMELDIEEYYLSLVKAGEHV
ncbi:ABC transporter ATP-binding protein [Enterococcus sp. CWB-B31]|uniref:ABC transporter ATP-binding protein n=1 Tax=Enterococcus sp. CWB-B31 TaxID=2885159 RepID=UPI001E5C4798|nr:ATP-binding cassette domain-containing protein [Enterococcus sp. CWB-B31]MCB5953941.1 ATP-binding cassette domain-containing protein [Enterococcus sp. CWB-B31]